MTAAGSAAPETAVSDVSAAIGDNTLGQQRDGSSSALDGGERCVSSRNLKSVVYRECRRAGCAFSRSLRVRLPLLTLVVGVYITSSVMEGG
ncbi:unnamed protein product [Ectocarpus sp. 4 AP-2014]